MAPAYGAGLLAAALAVVLLGTACFVWDHRRRRRAAAAHVRELIPAAPANGVWRGVQPAKGLAGASTKANESSCLEYFEGSVKQKDRRKRSRNCK